MSNEATIEQMNEVIGVFMGGFWKEFESGNFRQKRFYYKDKAFAWVTSPENLNYHKEWDELMPVVEKIEKDYCNIIELVIYSSSCCINKWNQHTGKYDSFIHETGNKRDAVYKAVYQFITWYNQQKQTNDNK